MISLYWVTILSCCSTLADCFCAETSDSCEGDTAFNTSSTKIQKLVQDGTLVTFQTSILLLNVLFVLQVIAGKYKSDEKSHKYFPLS